LLTCVNVVFRVSDVLCGFVPAYCAMDLMIIVDSSGSVRDSQIAGTPDNWNTTKDFVKEVIRRGTKIGQYYDRVSIIEFSSTANLVFDFNDYYSERDVLAAVDRLPFLGSLTNTSIALNLGRQVFLDPTRGSRPNATHIMLLVTDLVDELDPAWISRFLGSVTLLNATDIQRFCEYCLLLGF